MSRISPRSGLSTIALAGICVGYTCTINNVTLGAQLGTHMTFSRALLTLLIGFMILSVITVLNCLIGTREHATGKEIWCDTFGSRGGRIPSLLVCLCMIIFAFFDFWYVGDVFKQLFPSHSDVGFSIGMAVIVACAILGAFRGTESLKWLTRILIPFAISLLSVVIACIIQRADGMAPILQNRPASMISISEGINVVLGGFMICVGLWPDLTKDSSSQKATAIGIPVGLLMYCALFIVGIFGAVGIGSYGILAIATGLGGALSALTKLFVILAQASTIPSNTHMIATELQENIPAPRAVFIIGEPLLAAAASFVIEHVADISILSTWAGVIGVIFAPIAGVTIAKYWVVNRGRFACAMRNRPAFCKDTLVIAVTGIACGVYFTWFITTLPASITSLALTFVPESLCGPIRQKTNSSIAAQQLKEEI